MRPMTTMAVLACGMTLGLACGDTARLVLPPDASAQPDGGGERPAPRFIDVPCETWDARIDPLKVGLTKDDLFVARVWLCGPDPDPVVESPEALCVEKDFAVQDGGIISCSGSPFTGPPFGAPSAEFMRFAMPY